MSRPVIGQRVEFYECGAVRIAEVVAVIGSAPCNGRHGGANWLVHAAEPERMPRELAIPEAVIPPYFVPAQSPVRPLI